MDRRRLVHGCSPDSQPGRVLGPDFAADAGADHRPVEGLGAPLDGGREVDVPDYAGDPKGDRTPLKAHIRLANPRTEKTEPHRILRRGFSYSLGFGADGQLDQGLLFVSFQRDLDAGFVAIQRRLDGEPLEEYIEPFGGGYFFVLPGAATPDDWLGRTLIESA